MESDDGQKHLYEVAQSDPSRSLTSAMVRVDLANHHSGERSVENSQNTICFPRYIARPLLMFKNVT